MVDAAEVHRLLGREQYRNEQAERIDRPGVATGLVWTPVGGDIVFVEAARMPGREEGLILTGQLGDVMKESAQAALTCVRSDSDRLGIAAGRSGPRTPSTSTCRPAPCPRTAPRRA